MVITRALPLFCGALAGLGVWVFACAFVDQPPVEPDPRQQVRKRPRVEPRAFCVGVAAVIAATAITRWWAIPMLAGVGFVFFAGRLGPAQSDDGVVVGEAIASWSERVRDAIRAGAGLPAAIDASARTAPPPLAHAVRVLSATVTTEGVAEGLARFCAEVDHRACDTIAIALVVADRRGGGELTRVLDAQISSVRHEIALYREEDAQRTRFRTGVRIVLGAFGSSALGFRLFAPEFFAPYQRPAGQVALLIIGSIVIGGIGGIIRLGHRQTRRRPFGPDAIRRAALRSTTLAGA